MSLKSNFYIKVLLVIMLMIQVFCNERTEQSQPITTKSSPKVDTTLTGNFATAQIALNIETISGNTLAEVTLDFPAFFNHKGKYKTQKLLVDEGEKGPFSSFKIVDQAAISKNGIIQILMSFELQTQRITWETANGVLTGNYGSSAFKESIKSEGGSINGTATLLFDEKSMSLISQSSTFNLETDKGLKKDVVDFEDLNAFLTKHLKVRISTNIHWTNANCQNLECTTGSIREEK